MPSISIHPCTLSPEPGGNRGKAEGKRVKAKPLPSDLLDPTLRVQFLYLRPSHLNFLNIPAAAPSRSVYLPSLFDSPLVPPNNGSVFNHVLLQPLFIEHGEPVVCFKNASSFI